MVHDNNYPMNLDMWSRVNHFTPKYFGCIDMSGILVYTLEELRKYVNRPIIIHCGYEKRASGYHPKKCAVDLHIKGLDIVDQFLAASRFDNFNGIGVYPQWNSPGLHIDTRPKKHKMDHDARWGYFNGRYCKLDSKLFKNCLL